MTASRIESRAENATHVPDRRDAVAFTWHVSCGMPVYAVLAGVRFDRVFREADAIIEAYEVGRPRAEKLFGAGVSYGGPGWAGISYGHVNCLGCPLLFPEDSEVGIRPIYASLRDAIDQLQRPVDWATAGLMPFYLELWRKLRAKWPTFNLSFPGFGVEGPITTAWELRGQGFFTDLFDEPELMDQYLALVTESIVSYKTFVRSVNAQPALDHQGAVVCDDVAAMIPPRLWRRFVLPHLEQYFVAQTTGRRTAHIEDLVPDHLPMLDALGLDMFDPSVSPRLRPVDLRDRCAVPFMWRLTPMQLRDFDHERIRRHVLEAARDGASHVFCWIGREAAHATAAARVRTFIDTVEHVAQRLNEGVPRHELMA